MGRQAVSECAGHAKESISFDFLLFVFKIGIGIRIRIVLIMKKIVFITLASLGLSVGLYQAAFAKPQATSCFVTLNPNGSFTQHACSKRGNDTFQVVSGAKISIPGSVKVITCHVTHADGNVSPGFFNKKYFSSSSRTSASTFRVGLMRRGEVVIPNGTHLFDVSFKNKKWDFANSELNCSTV